jgi:hypothetical protein
MNIVGQRVIFRLSREGREILDGILSKRGSFSALVVDVDDFGPVIRMRGPGRTRRGGSFSAVLLRWDYIATIAFEYHQRALEFRPRIGFA